MTAFAPLKLFLRYFAALVAIVVVLSTTSTSFAQVTGLTTEVDGVTVDTVSVTRDGTPFIYDLADLIGVELTAFDGANASVVLTGDGDPVPATGSRASLLENATIDDGIVNADSSSSAVTLTFNAPVVNRPGRDIIWFELDPDSGSPDNFSVLINGQEVLVMSADAKVISGNSIDSDLHASTAGEVDTLAELESDTFSKTLDAAQALYAYSIDLSDFGVAPGGFVTSMQYGSSGAEADPTFFAGLPVPEPATWLLGAIGLVVGLFGCRRAFRH